MITFGFGFPMPLGVPINVTNTDSVWPHYEGIYTYHISGAGGGGAGGLTFSSDSIQAGTPGGRGSYIILTNEIRWRYGAKNNPVGGSGGVANGAGSALDGTAGKAAGSGGAQGASGGSGGTARTTNANRFALPSIFPYGTNVGKGGNGGFGGATASNGSNGNSGAVYAVRVG